MVEKLVWFLLADMYVYFFVCCVLWGGGTKLCYFRDLISVVALVIVVQKVYESFLFFQVSS
jgi:hypothetical protein